MGRKGQALEQVIAKLREVEISLAKGKTVAETCRSLGGCEQTFYCWRNEYQWSEGQPGQETDGIGTGERAAEVTLDKLILP